MKNESCPLSAKSCSLPGENRNFLAIPVPAPQKSCLWKVVSLSSAPYKYEYEYEYHTMRDAALPIMYHEERLPSGYGILTNWHENLEILWFTKGLGRVIIDNVQVDAEPGDLVFINSNCLHRILSIEDVAYYCLIIDRSFCLRSGIPAEKVRIQPRIRDGILRGNYKQIIRVLEEKPPYCEAEAQANILLLLARLYRGFQDDASEPESVGHKHNQLTMVRSAIQFLNSSYQQSLTIDDICRRVGSSKYHFCRVFRAVTGKTVVDYLNFLRCERAQFLLSTGDCNVQEAAERCGFCSGSYFSMVYKRQIGEAPSVTAKRGASQARTGS